MKFSVSIINRIFFRYRKSWLDLILSLFFYCCGCPRYWGRQQVARVSNTQSPRLSVQWIDAAKAAHFHVSLNTFRPGLFRSPSSSGDRKRHTCDGVYAWRGACNMSIPSHTPSAESCCHLLLLFVCLFDLILYVHSTIFQLCGTGLPGLNQN